jgi:hypothetical protein
MMTRVSRWIHNRRVQSLDLWSLANEISHSAASRDISRGVWTARIVGLTHKTGMELADVRLVAEAEAAPGAADLRWKSWKIAGRDR